MVGFLIAALLASAPVAPIVPVAPVGVPAQPARPAMWVLRDADTTIYLFGTFHALDGRTHWFDGNVRQAFSTSDSLVLETIIPERPKLSQGSTRRSGHSFSVPMHGFTVAPGASFLATARVAVTAGQEQGMQVSKGADMVLRHAAEADGKVVEGLELFDTQLGMFARMAPVEPAAAGSVEYPAAKARLSSVMTLMQTAWTRGDQRVFASLLEEMRRSTPENYRVMFPERNAQWAGWIARRMDQPGTVFVAVGAGHFAGPDSVLSKLTMRGLVATRLN
ncbi:MAG: TraB/GumN family protein [Sphingomicrobium sp.]